MSSVEISQNCMGYNVYFTVSGNKAAMKWIKAGDVSKFLEEVKVRAGNKSEPTG